MSNPTLDLDFARRQFPNLGNGWAYFENAGGSYLPQSVIQRMTAFGFALPWVSFMTWPTNQPMTLWLPARYCSA